MNPCWTGRSERRKRRAIWRRKEKWGDKSNYGGLGVPGEPDGGEMAPTELALHHISTILESVANSNSVVASTAVIFTSLVLRRVIAGVGVMFFLVLSVHGYPGLPCECRVNQLPKSSDFSRIKKLKGWWRKGWRMKRDFEKQRQKEDGDGNYWRVLAFDYREGGDWGAPFLVARSFSNMSRIFFIFIFK